MVSPLPMLVTHIANVVRAGARSARMEAETSASRCASPGDISTPKSSSTRKSTDRAKTIAKTRGRRSRLHESTGAPGIA